MMQSSPYSFYNEYYKGALEHVYATCEECNGPTDIPPMLPDDDPVFEPFCLSNKTYTSCEGETCESIANCTGVSGAALYISNQALIPDCSAIPPGTDLCIPSACEQYHVRPSDTCRSIEAALELSQGTLRYFNPWINLDCSNLQSAASFYGRIICTSPQGGRYNVPIAQRGRQQPPRRDGHARVVVDPPEGCDLAEGTTRDCGRWHVVEEGDTFVSIAMRNRIPAKLFRQVNPSLRGEDCDEALVKGTVVCVAPTYGWTVDEL